MNKTFDFAIVGGGILGTSFAFHLLKKGYSVALFDKNKTPAEASVRNFGQVVPSGFGSLWQKYGISSMEIYRSIQKDAALDLKEEGSLYIASNEEEVTLIGELNTINNQNQYDSILLDKTDIKKLYPEIKQSYAIAGLSFPLEIQINPLTTVSKILHWLENKHQLQYFRNVTIQDTETMGDLTVLTDNYKNKYHANKVFICSGHDFKTLYPQEFNTAGLKTVKLQMLAGKAKDTKIKGSILTGWSIRRYESFQECPSFNVITETEDTNSFHKKHGIHILAKQESNGRIILGDSHHYTQHCPEAESADYHDLHLVNTFMMDEAKKILNIDHFELESLWSGYYGQCTNQPIFIKEINQDITIVTGIGGKGMTASLGYTKEFLKDY
jgi:FAD dependent oxidoreductase TIGR03364